MTIEGEVIATGLKFPEGPVWRDGEVVFVEIEGGIVQRWNGPEGVSLVAATGGGPNGAAWGPDGALYITQNGGMSREGRVTAGIQRIGADGSVDMVATAVGGVVLEQPNDLAFGPDGRVWFTDPRGAADPARNQKAGRIFVLDLETGEGELVIELGPVFPNGIAFLGDGTLVWTESFTLKVNALVAGEPELVVQLEGRAAPDGLAVGSDGRLYVASTFSHAVSVVEDGVVVDRLLCGDGMATNCCFGGTDLYVTESRHGTLWRYPLGVEGLPLRFG